MATMNKPEPLGTNGTRAVAEKARDAASDLASTAKTVAKDQVTGRVNETKGRAVAGLGDVAGVLRRTGDDSGNATVQSYVTRAADGIEQVSDYFEKKQLGDMVSDVERFARREPGLFLGGAFALGLLAARFLKSSSSRTLELDEDDFVTSRSGSLGAMNMGAFPRPTPMRETPRPFVPLATQATVGGPQQPPRPQNIDPYPQQHTGVLDPSKSRGGEGNGSL